MEPQQYGRYSIEAPIGQGGMSVVYKAKDPVLDRYVALKLLHPHLAERADSRARFAREAKAVAKLKHSNIVEVFDYAPAESTRSYIVTEFIDGPTLREFLMDQSLLSPEAAVVLLQPIADALTRAHDAGIVHRDVKPENIMIRADGSPVLMDFGIAQMIDMPTLTATGTILGSPAHMAPEVIDGSEVDTAADVFSFGTVLYWAISGCLPFTGPNPSALFRRILETDFDPLSRHSETAGMELETLVGECLAKLPEMRPSARQVSARMRLHLESLNMKEFGGIRERLIRDRETTESVLIEQTVDELLNAAEANVVSGKLPVILDLVNRALAHKPNEERALKLLNKLERRRNVMNGLRWVSISLALIAPVVGLYFYLQTPIVEVANEPAPTPKSTSSAGITGNPISVPSAAAAAGNDAMVQVDAATDIADTGMIEKETEANNENTVVRLDQPRPRRTITPAQPKPLPVKPLSPPIDSANETPILVKVKSEYLAARVLLDGDRTNQLSLFELQRSGIKLKPGRHLIEIESAGCENDRHRISLRADQPELTIKHDCKFRNALLRVKTNGNPLEIRDKDDPTRRVLGSTNQTISLRMSGMKMRKNLLIRVADDRFENLQVDLEAGEETDIPFN